MDEELTTPHCKNKWHVLKCYKKCKRQHKLVSLGKKRRRMAKGGTEPTDYFIFFTLRRE
jgi:hypothetical protein